MISKKKMTLKEVAVEKARLRDVEKRFLSRNLESMKFCNENGLTIYAAAQRNNKVKVFVQHGIKFKPLSHREYDQYNGQDVMEYHAAIDIEYERIWKLKKNKQDADKKR
jgi:hypothetical protein